MTVNTLAPVESARTVELLLSKVATGDFKAFDALYTLTSTRVHGLILSMLTDVAVSENVTKEAYLDVWRVAPRYNPTRGGAITWILAIAHRHALECVRSSGPGQTRDPQSGALHHDAFDLFEEQVETVVQRGRAIRAIRHLSEAQRDGLTLAYWRGFTARQIAQSRGVSVSTVAALLRDGLLKLRFGRGDDFLADDIRAQPSGPGVTPVG